MTDVSTPPDQSVWWDEAAVTAAALDVLRLTDGDIDANRIAALVSAAGAAINDELDRPDTDPVPTPAPPVLANAIVEVVIELYRRKDAPPTSIDGMLSGSWRPQSFDPLAGVRSLITPYKSRWGVA